MTNHTTLSQRIHAGPLFLRIFFFIAGIVATIAYRITPFLNPFMVKVSWYVGTIGFILYFGHRAYVENKRAKLVVDYDLVTAVQKSDLQGDQKSAVNYLVKTSLTSKARYNSIFIFIASVLALIASVIMDLYF